MRNFSDLTEREILALAIANEEEDGRIYLDIAEGLRTDYPGSANVFTEMAGEEASIAAACWTSIAQNSASTSR
jgi:rubrerythrin